MVDDRHKYGPSPQSLKVELLSSSNNYQCKIPNNKTTNYLHLYGTNLQDRSTLTVLQVTSLLHWQDGGERNKLLLT